MKHYKTIENKRRERQFIIKMKIVNGYGDLFGENKNLQKSKHKRNNKH